MCASNKSFLSSSRLNTGLYHQHIRSPLPGKAPTPTTRLVMVNDEMNITASLSAMTVVHGGVELYEVRYGKGNQTIDQWIDARLVF